MLLEICLEKKCKIHFFPSLLHFGPQAFPSASPAPSRGPARAMRPASPARLPLARCVAQHRRRPNIATTAAPPLSPAADARAPPVGAVPFLPSGSEPPAPGAAATAATTCVVGAPPAPRPRFKGAEPPARSPAVPALFLTHAHATEAATAARKSSADLLSSPPHGPPSPSLPRPRFSPR